MKPEINTETAEPVQTGGDQAVAPAATCSDCSQEWYDGADSECIKCGFRKRGVSIAEVARNVSDVQRRIMDNAEIQDALKRLEFVIAAEMGRVKYISTNVDFEDGGTALLWIDPNDLAHSQKGRERGPDNTQD